MAKNPIEAFKESVLSINGFYEGKEFMDEFTEGMDEKGFQATKVLLLFMLGNMLENGDIIQDQYINLTRWLGLEDDGF